MQRPLLPDRRGARRKSAAEIPPVQMALAGGTGDMVGKDAADRPVRKEARVGRRGMQAKSAAPSFFTERTLAAYLS